MSAGTRVTPLVVLWDADSLLASLALRVCPVSVRIRTFLADELTWDGFRAAQRDPAAAVDASGVVPAAVLLGPAVLRNPGRLRLIHNLHRSADVYLLACGSFSTHESLLASELGVATTVSTLHDAIAAGKAIGRFLLAAA